MIPVRLICACGQKFTFDVQPAGGVMPVPVFCPACGRDCTGEANQFIARVLNGKTQPLAPVSVNSLLISMQSALAPHLTQAIKDAIVQELAAQRRDLLRAQQQVTAELTELARRLEQAQTPLFDRLRIYEQRIHDLEKQLDEQAKENHELLKLKIEATRRQLEVERSRVQFN
jgi:septal ring factor EnvC (AmiA/AmiB activator)